MAGHRRPSPPLHQQQQYNETKQKLESLKFSILLPDSIVPIRTDRPTGQSSHHCLLYQLLLLLHINHLSHFTSLHSALLNYYYRPHSLLVCIFHFPTQSHPNPITARPFSTPLRMAIGQGIYLPLAGSQSGRSTCEQHTYVQWTSNKRTFCRSLCCYCCLL